MCYSYFFSLKEITFNLLCILFKSVTVSFDHNLSAIAAVLGHIFESMFKGAASSLHSSLPSSIRASLPENNNFWVMDRSGNDYPR
jgi:hypothetical protein